MEAADASGSGLSVEHHVDGDHTVLEVAGEIDFETAPLFRAAVEESLDRCGRVALDLRATTFMDSSGLAVLVDAHARLGQVHEGVVLRGASPIVLRVLEVTGIGDIIDVRTDGNGDQAAVPGDDGPSKADGSSQLDCPADHQP